MEQRKYPSALGSFDEIAAAAVGKKIVVFLDYDGTLSPIVENPDAAFMSESVRFFAYHAGLLCLGYGFWLLNFMGLSFAGFQMRAAVKSVAKYFPTAIVTGRCIDKVHC